MSADPGAILIFYTMDIPVCLPIENLQNHNDNMGQHQHDITMPNNQSCWHRKSNKLHSRKLPWLCHGSAQLHLLDSQG